MLDYRFGESCASKRKQTYDEKGNERRNSRKKIRPDAVRAPNLSFLHPSEDALISEQTLPQFSWGGRKRLKHEFSGATVVLAENKEIMTNQQLMLQMLESKLEICVHEYSHRLIACLIMHRNFNLTSYTQSHFQKQTVSKEEWNFLEVFFFFFN